MNIICFCFIIFFIEFINSNPIEINENPMLGDKFEGDIAGVTFDTLKGLSQVPNANYEKWPGGVVPYIISSTYTPQQVSIIQSGMKLIEDQTRVNGKDCIKFVRRSDEATYLQISSQSGCWSYVGKMKSAGAQQVSLQSPSCVYAGIAAHELMHALGFWHEQSRADRDNFVKINWGNILSNQEYNFDKYTTGVDTLGFGYDYYSLMHYEWNAFSRNGQATIESLTPGITLEPAWKKTSLSSTDVAEIQKFYGCR